MTLGLELNGFGRAGVRHRFFGRKGGHSVGPYATLNCALASPDPGVTQNRALVATTIGGAPERLITLAQVHSARVITATAPFNIDQRPDADASVTDVPGLILGALSADCAPVLFIGHKQNGAPVVGAAHAGWRGVLDGVLENTVTAMVDLGAERSSIAAAIGPCIGAMSYQVSTGFEIPFLARDPEDERFFRSRNGVPDKLWFDLAGYAARRLALADVPRVVLADIDTVTHPDDYFSYRRSCLEQSGENGRQISVVMIA
jgi:hypothetical protein